MPTLGGSFVAGFFAAACSLPFDYVKTQLQKQRPNADGTMPYSSAADCAVKTMKSGGPLQFYSGFSTYIVRCGRAAVSCLCGGCRPGGGGPACWLWLSGPGPPGGRERVDADRWVLRPALRPNSPTAPHPHPRPPCTTLHHPPTLRIAPHVVFTLMFLDALPKMQKTVGL